MFSDDYPLVDPELRVLAEHLWQSVLEQREQILKAFIAETGLPPSEVEQVVLIDLNCIRWFVRKQEPLPDGAQNWQGN